MSTTVAAFKLQQEKNQLLLNKLSQFIQKGQLFGLIPNPDLMNKLQTAIQAVDTGILKVALIGGFSEGKTSIASAWLERLDQSMNISQQESSNEVKIYTLGDDIELIDTPGLFGFKEQENSQGQIEKYKEITQKYVSEAHLVIYVMNSANPIKESHKEDLIWLFRELNLLARTVFVLSRFDEVADIEDDWDYRESLNTKKQNVSNRLKEMISLSEAELNNLKIVAIAANPYGEGVGHWLQNLEEFKKISRIQTLQDATRKTIEENGGSTPIVLEAQKSMIQDVLKKQMPLVRERQAHLNHELLKLSDTALHLNYDLEPLESKITRVRIDLKDFVLNHFTSLIRKVQGSDLNTFSDFYENELGNDGIVLSTRIQQEFDRQCQTITSSLQRISLDFNNEMLRFEASVGSDLLNKGLGLLGQQKLTNTHILGARDGIVAAGKMVGVDLAKYLKFKPWGAINLASRVNFVMASVSLLIEAWDSYKKAQAEADFKKLVADIVATLEDQRSSLLSSLDDTGFIQTLFPQYQILKTQFAEINLANENTAKRKLEFDEWENEGLMIEGEYRVLENQSV